MKKPSESIENYLKAILISGEYRGFARVKDIAKITNVKTSTVTAAVERLSRLGYVRHESYGYVELTASGLRYAKDVHKKQQTLTKFLRRILDIDPRTAQQDACGMEHVASHKTLGQLVKFMEFLEGNVAGDMERYLSRFRAFCKTRARESRLPAARR